jgi:acyl-CoA oxidase
MSDSFSNYRTRSYAAQSLEGSLYLGCSFIDGFLCQVRGIETVTTYDPNTQEFIINTPCESAQKYWIGGAAKYATHSIVFSQLLIDGRNEGIHAFICQLRDDKGNVCPGLRIADCGHKIGLNGIDNGRIWFDKVHIPRENLLNSVADVTPDGHYQSMIKDPDQVMFVLRPGWKES